MTCYCHTSTSIVYGSILLGRVLKVAWVHLWTSTFLKGLALFVFFDVLILVLSASVSKPITAQNDVIERGVDENAIVQLRRVDLLPFLHQFPQDLYSDDSLSVLARIHYSALVSPMRTFLYAVADRAGFVRVMATLHNQVLQVVWRRSVSDRQQDVVWLFPFNINLLRRDQFAVLSLGLSQSMGVLIYHVDQCSPVPFFVVGSMDRSADIRFGNESWYYPEVRIVDCDLILISW